MTARQGVTMQYGVANAEAVTPWTPKAEEAKAGAARVDTAKGGATGSALTVVAPIVGGREDALRRLLDAIGTSIAKNPYFSFDALASVHFLRWVVLDPAPGSEQSLLAFESNYDGTVEEHLAELLTVAPRGVHAIYAHCVGYPTAPDGVSPPSASAAIAYLLGHAIEYRAFYVGVPGLSATRIKGEQAVRAVIEQYLSKAYPDGDAGKTPALTIYQDVVAAVRARAELAWVFDETDPPFPLRPGKLLLGAAAAAVALPAVVPALLLVRLKEWLASPVEDHVISDAARELMAREDLQVQNQLTHVVPIRPGLLRRAALSTVLAAIDFLARELFNRGNLGGIASIHFARWAYLEDGHRLLFFSNYDGSWESYLGDFIDRAHVGLTSVWSNTQGFPKTVFLLFKGATDEERFKAWTRAYQVPTQLWYSAYPTLTVDNILVNRKICAGLREPIDGERRAREWLAYF